LLILFGFLLLILAAAVGVLFAMCAELSRRIATSSGGTSSGAPGANGYARPVDRPNVFLRPDVSWPREFDELRSRDAFLLLVLSTVCTTCNSIGSEIGREWATRPDERLGIVISAPDISRGEEFVAQCQLDNIPHLVDEDGSWTTKAFGLSLSPVGLMFLRNNLLNSYVFNHMEPLWQSFKEEIAWAQDISQHQQSSQPDDLAAGDSSAPSVRAV
jgi:hypothetical protein